LRRSGKVLVFGLLAVERGWDTEASYGVATEMGEHPEMPAQVIANR
jgi:hypothetical protein